jgi:Flp pilus assembly pilin Flp
MIDHLSSLVRYRGRNRSGFAADERGVTAVEFALLAMPFFTIIAGILQTSVIFLATQILESAVLDSARMIRTGQLQQSGRDLDDFRDEVCGRLFGMFPDCDGLHIRVQEVLGDQFANAEITAPIDRTCNTDEIEPGEEIVCDWTESEGWAPGLGERVVLVQVYYRYPVVISFGPLGMADLPDGTRLLGSAAVFKNEPFSGG